jgi:hypothetical protein
LLSLITPSPGEQVTDLTGDGKQDVFLPSRLGGQLFLGDGAGLGYTSAMSVLAQQAESKVDQVWLGTGKQSPNPFKSGWGADGSGTAWMVPTDGAVGAPLVADVDNDGWDDFVLSIFDSSGSESDAGFRRPKLAVHPAILPGRYFEALVAPAQDKAALNGVFIRSLVADLNADGAEDLFVMTTTRHELYAGDGVGGFAGLTMPSFRGSDNGAPHHVAAAADWCAGQICTRSTHTACESISAASLKHCWFRNQDGKTDLFFFWWDSCNALWGNPVGCSAKPRSSAPRYEGGPAAEGIPMGRLLWGGGHW